MGGVSVFAEEEEDTHVLKISYYERERRREQRDYHLQFFFVSLAANTAEKREKRERGEREVRERLYLSRCLRKNKTIEEYSQRSKFIEIFNRRIFCFFWSSKKK